LGRLGTSLFTNIQQNVEHAIAMVNTNGSITTKYQLFNAADALNLPITIGLDPKNITLNITMILILSSIFMIGTIFALKKKDTL
jgi:hypothetical protein